MKKTRLLPFRVAHIAAGFVAVLVGYTSSAVIIFQAADAIGATPEQISSWLWALGIGMGVTSIALSLFYKMPILTAWSTPGAALLVTSLSGLSMNEAIGAFIVSSALITLCGLAGWFNGFVRSIPTELASAVLAGVLFAFGINVFVAMQSNAVLVGLMLVVFFTLKFRLPRYAIFLTLIVGVLTAIIQGEVMLSSFEASFTTPVWIMPKFTAGTIIGVAIPLFIVTMASQNIPGYAALRAHGYQINPSPLMTWTGVAGIVLAPFGGYAFNLAAITAAICMTREVDEDPKRRFMAPVWAGLFYVLTGIFGASVVSLFLMFPTELVMAIAGIALITTIANSLTVALSNDQSREPALLTFMITVSGISLFGIGSAFWGLLIGLLANYWFRKKVTAPSI